MTRRKSSFVKNMKDYIVPIIGVGLIIVLLYSIFTSGESNEVQTSIEKENKIGLDVSLEGLSTEAYIVYPGDYKKQIEGEIKLYKGEKIIVKEGSSVLNFLSIGDFRLNKLGELKYGEAGMLSLFSGELWFNSDAKTDIDMRYAKISVGADSHVSFSQNEVGSSIYLLNGFVEVSNLAGKTSVLAPGQKITVSRLDSNSKEVDLSLNREDIDDYFKTTSWFIKNKGASYLASEEEEETSTGSSVSAVSATEYLDFENLLDESQVSEPSITIAGTYDDAIVARITLNGKNAVLGPEKNSFTFEEVNTSNKINDLVFKVFDINEDVISKTVYTVYYDAGVSGSSAAGFTATTYDVDASKFTFTAPNTTGVYSTFESFITIWGKVLDKNVASVTVNDYKLKSYNGSTWRYHASHQNNNLSNGTNVYQIKYFDAEGNVIYTNTYTIVKKVKTSAKSIGTISSEVTAG